MALSLIEKLDGFHAEVVPRDDERFQVRVDLDGRPGPDRLLLESLGRVERWLDSSGLEATQVHLNGYSYRLRNENRIPDPPSPRGDLDGLAFQVRRVPLGGGVQVVLAEGDLDLHTTPQLKAALQSTDGLRVILDLTEVPFMDSTALGAIVAARKSMRAQGRELIAVPGNPVVSKVLSVTGLDSVLTVRPSLAEAITSALDGSASPAR